MKLTIPTWLLFLVVGIASFAPLVSLRPGWWMPYYGALLLTVGFGWKSIFPTAGVVNGVATTLNLCCLRKAGQR